MEKNERREKLNECGRSKRTEGRKESTRTELEGEKEKMNEVME